MQRLSLYPTVLVAEPLCIPSSLSTTALIRATPQQRLQLVKSPSHSLAEHGSWPQCTLQAHPLGDSVSVASATSEMLQGLPRSYMRRLPPDYCVSLVQLGTLRAESRNARVGQQGYRYAPTGGLRAPFHSFVSAPLLKVSSLST